MTSCLTSVKLYFIKHMFTGKAGMDVRNYYEPPPDYSDSESDELHCKSLSAINVRYSKPRVTSNNVSVLVDQPSQQRRGSSTSHHNSFAAVERSNEVSEIVVPFNIPRSNWTLCEKKPTTTVIMSVQQQSGQHEQQDPQQPHQLPSSRIIPTMTSTAALSTLQNNLHNSLIQQQYQHQNNKQSVLQPQLHFPNNNQTSSKLTSNGHHHNSQLFQSIRKRMHDHATHNAAPPPPPPPPPPPSVASTTPSMSLAVQRLPQVRLTPSPQSLTPKPKPRRTMSVKSAVNPFNQDTMKPLINEFRFYQKTQKNILGQKSELQKVRLICT